MQIDTQELSEKFYNATVTDFQRVHEDLFVIGVKPDAEFDLFLAVFHTSSNWINSAAVYSLNSVSQ